MIYGTCRKPFGFRLQFQFFRVQFALAFLFDLVLDSPFREHAAGRGLDSPRLAFAVDVRDYLDLAAAAFGNDKRGRSVKRLESENVPRQMKCEG